MVRRATPIRARTSDGKISAQLNPSNRLIGFAHWAQKFTRSEGGQFNEWGSGSDRCCPPLRSQVNKIEWEMVRKNLVTSVQFGNWQWTAPVNIESMSPAVQIYTDDVHGGGRPATYDQVTQYNTGTNPSAGNYDIAKRYHTRAALSYYKSDLFLGNHEFKAGFDYMPNQIGWNITSAARRANRG
jgi:hypothetical protein